MPCALPPDECPVPRQPPATPPVVVSLRAPSRQIASQRDRLWLLAWPRRLALPRCGSIPAAPPDYPAALPEFSPSTFEIPPRYPGHLGVQSLEPTDTSRANFVDLAPQLCANRRWLPRNARGYSLKVRGGSKCDHSSAPGRARLQVSEPQCQSFSAVAREFPNQPPPPAPQEQFAWLAQACFRRERHRPLAAPPARYRRWTRTQYILSKIFAAACCVRIRKKATSSDHIKSSEHKRQSAASWPLIVFFGSCA